MNKKNIIEINGKRYDSRTGELLSGFESPSTTVVSPQVVTPSKHVKKPAKHSVQRHAPNHSKHHAPSHSKTLKREAVKKPAPGLKRRIKIQVHTDALAKPTLANIKRSPSVSRFDERRLSHAKRVSKSHHVSHFVSPTIDKHHPITKIAHKTHHLPVFAVSAPLAPVNQTSNLLENALAQATSHLQPPVKPRRSRARQHASIASTVALAVALIALVAVQNVGSAKLQVASAQAGFEASLPAYKPPGFSQAKLDYAPGMIATQYLSNSDKRAYTITQKSTGWNNDNLLQNFVKPADGQYQAVAAAGRTVYIYGQHNATWLKDGIWYLVQTNGVLNDRQLVELATSS